MDFKKVVEQRLTQGVFGFPTALAASVGVIMASAVILTATSGFAMGGWVFFIALMVALLLMILQATTFAEAAAMMPTSGSVYHYLLAGLGRFWAVTGTITAYFLVNIFAGTAETVLSGVMVTINFPEMQAVLEANNLTWLVGVGLMTTFAILNFFGIHAFAKVEVFLTLFIWLTLFVFGAIGFFGTAAVPTEGMFGASQIGSDSSAMLSLIGLGVFMFVGFEYVTPLTPELRNASRTLPKAMLMGLALVGLAMVLWGAGMARQVENVALDPAGAVHILETPLAIPLYAEAIMGSFGRIWVGIAFLLGGSATINTIMAAIPRMLAGMARDGSLPKVFALEHPKYKSPWVGIIATWLPPVCYAIYINGNVDLILPLVLAAVCCWAVAYILINISIVLLRIRRPDLPRAYKSPLFPIPQIAASVGLLIAVWFIAPPSIPQSAIYTPFAVMFGLTAVFALIWVTLIQKKPAFTPVPVEELMAAEIAYYKEH